MILWRNAGPFSGNVSYAFVPDDVGSLDPRTVLFVSFRKDDRNSLAMSFHKVKNSLLCSLIRRYEKQKDPTLFLFELSPYFDTEDWEVSLGKFLEHVVDLWGDLWRG